jgi:hypothetical protein
MKAVPVTVFQEEEPRTSTKPAAPPVGFWTVKVLNVRGPQVTAVVALTALPKLVPLIEHGTSDPLATLSERSEKAKRSKNFIDDFLIEPPHQVLSYIHYWEIGADTRQRNRVI